MQRTCRVIKAKLGKQSQICSQTYDKREILQLIKCNYNLFNYSMFKIIVCTQQTMNDQIILCFNALFLFCKRWCNVWS